MDDAEFGPRRSASSCGLSGSSESVTLPPHLHTQRERSQLRSAPCHSAVLRCLLLTASRIWLRAHVDRVCIACNTGKLAHSGQSRVSCVRSGELLRSFATAVRSDLLCAVCCRADLSAPSAAAPLHRTPRSATSQQQHSGTRALHRTGTAQGSSASTQHGEAQRGHRGDALCPAMRSASSALGEQGGFENRRQNDQEKTYGHKDDSAWYTTSMRTISHCADLIPIRIASCSSTMAENKQPRPAHENKRIMTKTQVDPIAPNLIYEKVQKLSESDEYSTHRIDCHFACG